ncbi:MAG TPA: Sec-independent protein translocase protein TatB [Accumulibacter sp.]|jgi:sec-independent protein translocase protein TatB|nr:Sec-independent protein translocase protein TatB [Accumulibacter sp.]HQC80138.1 Sec-independent protein translocase protein TatB [Accumulibacter sp.]
MFDIGFSEMLVIAVVALVVIGPERLPKVARTTGHLLGRLQRYVSDVKSDINREIQLDELRKLQAEIEESARNVQLTLTNEVQSAQHAIEQTLQTVKAIPDTPRGPESPPSPSAVSTGTAESPNRQA